MSAKSSKMKYVAITVVIVVLVLGAFLVVRSRTRPPTEEASQLIAGISQETGEISSLWKNVESNVENLRMIDTTYDRSHMTEEVEYSKTARSTIASMKEDLDSIRAHEDNVAGYLQDLKGMKLPDWFAEYIDLRTEIADKDQERVDKAKQMLDNLDTYYAFTEEFLLGMISEYDMETALKDGSDLAVDQDYQEARQQFETALDYNSKVKTHADAASNILSFDYLNRVESNREEAEAVIQKFIQVCDLADQGSRNEARDLYEEADQDYRSLERLHLNDFKPENQNWWKENIESISGDIKELTRQMEDLEYQANSLVERHKPS